MLRVAVVASAILLASIARADAIDTTVEAVMTRMHVPGVAVAVVRDGKIEKQATYGVASLEWNAPVTADTRFQIASTTKIFTGTLVMLLVQDGVLALDAPVPRYLPDAPAAWQSITIAHLAAHASGIADKIDPAATTVEQATAGLAKLPLAFAPGTRAAYGLSDISVLDAIFARVTGMAFPALVKKRIADPLGFTCTTFERAADDGPTRRGDVIVARAGVYRWERDRQRTATYFYPERTYASGGAFSCIGDLVKWAAAMDRGTLLTAASEQRAATPFTLADGSAAGFGVVVSAGTLRGLRAYGHSGGPALADVVRIPAQKLTVIVLTNQQRLYPNLAPALAQLVMTPGREPPALRDRQPALTAKLRGVLEGIAAGRVAEAPFAPSVRAELVPALRDAGPLLTAVLPALDRLALVEDRRAGTQHIRRYRASYGRIAFVWKLVLDAREQIVDVELQVE